jgi:predicted lipoprotein with Yx(FWY)xxD motif
MYMAVLASPSVTTMNTLNKHCHGLIRTSARINHIVISIIRCKTGRGSDKRGFTASAFDTRYICVAYISCIGTCQSNSPPLMVTQTPESMT